MMPGDIEKIKEVVEKVLRGEFSFEEVNEEGFYCQDDICINMVDGGVMSIDYVSPHIRYSYGVLYGWVSDRQFIVRFTKKCYEKYDECDVYYSIEFT